MSVLTLRDICLKKLMHILEECEMHPQMINDLCKCLGTSPHLLEPVLHFLLEKKSVTDVALLAFLVPDRMHLDIAGVSSVRNSTLKMIGGNCPQMISLNLSDCVQISNAVVRSVLQGCSSLREIRLDRCIRITDAAFDPNMSPFDTLYGSFTLENISLQGCNQITGKLASMLRKHCRRLKYLNLSHCKQITAPSIQEIFVHDQLRSIKLAFTAGISDEVFLMIPPLAVSNDYAHPPGSEMICAMGGGFDQVAHVGPQHSLEHIELGSSSITDQSLFRLARCGSTLKDISLQWCDSITDEGVCVLVRHCLALQDINLRSCCGITDDSLQVIGQVCSGLKRLNISWCQDISDEGVKQLTPSHSGTCTLLESLCVVWCPRVSDVSLRALMTLPLLTTVEAGGCDGISEACISQLDLHGIKVYLR